MSASFMFYDLETTGFSPREARIMQFAGQRTDMELRPIGEPFNFFIKISDDVLPEPDAVLITGITPQMAISEGLTEAEFLKIFYEQIAMSDTIFVGFNSIRFDDEFMRFMHYRNFYDAYEWQWRDRRSRWDILDLVRITRALRPDGIKWPVDSSGVPANRLELLTSINGLDHQHAHDALNDVLATIAVARLIKDKQPKLFDYMLNIRDKKKLAVLIADNKPFVYTSGKYPSKFEKTTVVIPIAESPEKGGVLVFDLRHDPEPYQNMTPEELADRWKYKKNDPLPRLPVKTLKYNRCPAVAPLSVLNNVSQNRLQLDMSVIATHQKKLQADPQFSGRLLEALKLLDKKTQPRLVDDESDVDKRLYEGFFDETDKTKMSLIRAASMSDLKELHVSFKDQRLQSLLPLYKARNYPASLTDDERVLWERFRERKLLGGGNASHASRYFARLAELSERKGLSKDKRYLLEELQLYGQSILPDSPAY